jgi:hypothetical protein
MATTTAPMPGRTTRRLRVTTPQLPAAVEQAPAPISKAASTYEELRERAAAAIAELRDLETRRPQVEQADRDALSAAMRNGDQDPGPQAVAALDAELDAAERRATGLLDATVAEWAAFTAVLAAHADTWRDQLQATEHKHTEAAAKALDQAAVGIDATAHTRAVARWLGDANKTLNHGTVGGNQTARRFPNPGTAQAGSTAVHTTRDPHDTGWYIATLREWLHHP